jgi:hypothetical protein
VISVKEVKLCPICGKEAIFDGINETNWHWYHECANNVEFAANYTLPTVEEAIIDWNSYVSVLEDFRHESYKRGYDVGNKKGYRDGLFADWEGELDD